MQTISFVGGETGGCSVIFIFGAIPRVNHPRERVILIRHNFVQGVQVRAWGRHTIKKSAGRDWISHTHTGWMDGHETDGHNVHLVLHAPSYDHHPNRQSLSRLSFCPLLISIENSERDTHFSFLCSNRQRRQAAAAGWQCWPHSTGMAGELKLRQSPINPTQPPFGGGWVDFDWNGEQASVLCRARC